MAQESEDRLSPIGQIVTKRRRRADFDPTNQRLGKIFAAAKSRNVS
jgi:hypothetical protein